MDLIYICSPLRGNMEQNIRKAVEYCAYAADQGVIPLAPHTIFTQYLDDTIPSKREQALQMGIELLRRCNQIWVCGDTISAGMESEINFAKEHGITIRYISEAEIARSVPNYENEVVVHPPGSLRDKLSVAQITIENRYQENIIPKTLSNQVSI